MQVVRGELQPQGLSRPYGLLQVYFGAESMLAAT
jgi:hypothetical protein